MKATIFTIYRSDVTDVADCSSMSYLQSNITCVCGCVMRFVLLELVACFEPFATRGEMRISRCLCLSVLSVVPFVSWRRR